MAFRGRGSWNLHSRAWRTMTTFTVVIPTHDHADTLRYAVRSVLWQTCQDFEILVVGDGVPDRAREIVAALMAEDARIRFFDCPKGQRLGELHRHLALQEAQGRFVAYQADDDLWLPEHLATLAGLLEEHDLVHSMQMEAAIDGHVTSWMFDALSDPLGIDKMRNSQTGFGLASGAHRLDAYRRLPRGWHPAPTGIHTDLYFWLQFLDEPWCRYRSHKWPTILHLSSIPRKHWTIEQRVEELSMWWDRIQTPAQRALYVQQCLLPLHDTLVKDGFRGSSTCNGALATELERLAEVLRTGTCASSRLLGYPSGQELVFGHQGNADRYLLTGFAAPEPWGRWTAGATAQVLLPLAVPLNGAARLDLKIVPFLHPLKHPVCAFSVCINDLVVLQVNETRGETNHYQVVLPEPLFAGCSLLVIGFHAESPARPVDLGMNDDARLIGLGLVSMRISLESEAPAMPVSGQEKDSRICREILLPVPDPAEE